MSKLQSALALASQGFWIFPLRENSKLPLIKDFPNRATRDPKKITDWWTDPVMEFELAYNVGISTDKFEDDRALIAIDVDNKGLKKGNETLEELDILGKEVPETFTQFTPTGGRHLIYAHSEALKQGVDTLGNGLDIRSKGGYIVGAGSTLDGKEYTFSPVEVAYAPHWLTSQLGKAKEKSTALAPTNINQENAKERAIYYLENEAPEASSGARNQDGYKTACKLKDFGVDELTCLELMQDHWKCEPMLDDEELTHVCHSAYQYGTEVIGADSPEAAFVPVEMSEETLHYLDKINKEYALVFIGSSHSILHETVDEKGRSKVDFLSELSFKRKFSPSSLQKRGTWATEWLDWPGRREYAGICFAPEREARNNYYNMWKGFTVEPLPYSEATFEQKRGFDAFLGHVKENICQNDNDLYLWVMGFFAHLIQKPYERPLTSLVFKGEKGSGKNAFVDRIGNLLGDGHYITAHDGRYLTSNFNGHLESCLCLVLDEAFWSGDKAAEGKLKGITTSPEHIIERKGKETYTVDNLVRIIIIGNEDWLVPASKDERRYAVCDVGNGRKQDNEFFQNMRVDMDDLGGNRVLLHHLKTFDLSTVDINRAPKTAGLLAQKLNSLEPFENWWFNSLKSGKILNSEFGDEWPDNVDTHSFRSAFNRTVKELGIRSRSPDEASIGIRLKKMAPGIVRTKRREGERTLWVYKLPTLEDARKDWDTHIGQEGLWE